MKVRILNAWCLVIGAPIEELAGDTEAKTAAQRYIQIRSRSLQQMVRAHSVEHVQVVRFIRKDEEVSAVALQREKAAEIGAGAVVVVPRAGRHALAGVF